MGKEASIVVFSYLEVNNEQTFTFSTKWYKFLVGIFGLSKVYMQAILMSWLQAPLAVLQIAYHLSDIRFLA